MKTIGITGGVGAGKSAALSIIKENYNADIIIADKVAYELESPGGVCYDDIVGLVGRDCLDESGLIDKGKMAARIFGDPRLLSRVNSVIHPAVKQYILERIERERNAGVYDLLVVEAALLIQDGYGDILDEIWLISVKDEVRRRRLKESRGYSDEKIDSILMNQMTDDEYAEYCSEVIDNSLDLMHLERQIDECISRILEK